MDDDAPLATLATAKLDDDMPLASLATAAPPKPSKAGGAKGRPPAKPAGAKPPAAPKAKGKAAAAKSGAAKSKPGQSSSSSSSSSSDSDSSEEGGAEKPKKKKPAVSKKGRVALLKKQKSGGVGGSTGDLEGDEVGAEDAANNKVTKRDRTPKQQVVAELLCRWWYCLPDWPPNDDAYYKDRLEKEKLRQVTIQEWEWVPEEDDRGFHKVYQLSQFRGCFRKSTGELVDLRPKESCPCYSNFMSKELPDLYDLLVTAYENQLKDLENSKYNEKRTKKELETTLNKVKDRAYQAKQIGGIKRAKTA